MSAPVILLTLADGHALALDLDEYERAVQRARELVPAKETEPAELVGEIADADGMASRTGVPATWWLEAARRGDVPHIRAGKYVRFRLAQALDALSSIEPRKRVGA